MRLPRKLAHWVRSQEGPSNTMKGPDRMPAQLAEPLHHQLNMYALAASAAGVSLLALAQAEAKIIYTPANRLCPCKLDINHDGMKDFEIYFRGDRRGRHPFVTNEVLFVSPLNGNNQIWGYPRGASALAAGVKIGTNAKFKSYHSFMVSWFIEGTSHTTNSGVNGPWANVQNRYLGLKFISVKGQIHYGWARLNVSAKVRNITATLTGYAYETIPNKPIIAGKTHDADDAEQPVPASLTSPTPKTATLGALAIGAPGLSIWRKKEVP
jgi:hypothetical protein